MSQIKQALVIEYRNQLFLDKRCRYPWQSLTRTRTLGLLMFIAAVIGFAIVLQSVFDTFWRKIDPSRDISSNLQNAGNELIGVILIAVFLLFFIIMVPIQFKQVAKYRKLQRQGKLVQGVLLEIERQMRKGHRSPARWYDITISVAFRAPDSPIQINGERQYTTVHNHSDVLLQPQTPVYIMYVDEDTWEVL